jgi:hypothetical protein
MSTKKRVAAVLITTVAISAGTVGIASADAKSKTNRVSVASSTMKGPRGLDLAATLSALVAKGTITQAQADAVLAAANAARAAADAMRPAKPDHAARLALIATTGVDAATIQTRLAAGETLAAIAGAKKDALIAALVADETKRIDAAVTAGKLTAAQATAMKTNLTAHVTAEVNSVRPMGGKLGHKDGKGGKGGHGPKGGVAGTTALTLPAVPAA